MNRLSCPVCGNQMTACTRSGITTNPTQRAGGRRAAILFSLVATCKANAVEPWAYLRNLFARLPALPDDQLDELLPDRWLTTHPQHRWHIDDLRRQERQQKRR